MFSSCLGGRGGGKIHKDGNSRRWRIKQTPDRLFSLWPPKKRPMFHRSLECTKETDVEDVMPLMISITIYYTLIQIWICVYFAELGQNIHESNLNKSVRCFLFTSMHQKDGSFFWKWFVCYPNLSWRKIRFMSVASKLSAEAVWQRYLCISPEASEGAVFP